MRLRLARVLERAGRLPELQRTGRRRSPVWTPKHEAFLGHASDRRLAELWGVDEHAVWKRRNQLNLRPYGDRGGINARRWTEEMHRRLGRISDREFARRYRISLGSVALKRAALGIATCGMRWNKLAWTKRMLSQLGKRHDQAIAATLNLAESTVRAKRDELGITPLRRTAIDWSSPRVRKLLGSDTDEAIARQLAVATETVRIKRAKLGIPRYRRLHWTTAIIDRLGKVPDQAIADEVGATVSAVAWQRNQRGIPPWRGSGRRWSTPCQRLHRSRAAGRTSSGEPGKNR